MNTPSIEEIVVEAWAAGHQKPLAVIAFAEKHHQRVLKQRSVTVIMSNMRRENRLPVREKKKKPSVVKPAPQSVTCPHCGQSVEIN